MQKNKQNKKTTLWISRAKLRETRRDKLYWEFIGRNLQMCSECTPHTLRHIDFFWFTWFVHQPGNKACHQGSWSRHLLTTRLVGIYGHFNLVSDITYYIVKYPFGIFASHPKRPLLLTAHKFIQIPPGIRNHNYTTIVGLLDQFVKRWQTVHKVQLRCFISQRVSHM